ncbi:MAG: hypothetical protein KH284_13620 [Clostridiales bacterium]|nr:hypothetical protein [Clostridiales bacterium]
MREKSFARKAHSSIMQLDYRMNKYRFLTGNALKLIAVSVMLFDHFCKIVLQWILHNYWFELYQSERMTSEQYVQIDSFIRFDLFAVGTIAFPIFCFLLAEGFRYTSSRKRYVGMMLAFAIISEIPFDLGFFSDLSKRDGTFPFFWGYQNVFFTLFLSLIALECIEYFSCKSGSRSDKVKSLLLQIVSAAVIATVAELIGCDYGKNGVLFVIVFYIFRENRFYQILLFLVVYILVTNEQPTVYTLLSCLIILLYNGTRGKLKLKYSFYAFYPIHIAVLYLITLLLPRMFNCL